MTELEISILRDRQIRHVRLLMWLLLIMLHLITSFHRVSFNVVADLLTAEFNLTGAGLGNLAAAYTYMYVIMQIPGGILVDRLGSRKIACLTGLLMAAGSMTIGLAPTAPVVFLGRLLIGLGGSVVLINIFKFQAAWFRPAEFATMSGLALLISTSGSLLAATPLALAVDAFGWRHSFFSFGLSTVLVALLCWIVVRNNPVDRFGQAARAAAGSPAAGESMMLTSATVKQVLANRRIWIPFLLNMGTYSGFVVFAGTWGVSYLVHGYRFTVEHASVYMLIAYLGYMIGAPGAGYLSDRLGSRKKPALVLVGCTVLFWFLLAAWPGGVLPVWLLYPLCLLIGIGGAATVMSFPMAREVSIPGCTGLVTAAVNMGVFLGLAILQPLFGLILDAGWGGLMIDGARVYPIRAYQTGFAVILVFASLSFVATLFHRED